MNSFSNDHSLWLSLPMPAVLIDGEDRIEEINPATESFMNSSAKSVKGTPAFDTLAIDAPLEGALRRVREDQAPLVINGVDVQLAQ